MFLVCISLAFVEVSNNQLACNIFVIIGMLKCITNYYVVFLALVNTFNMPTLIYSTINNDFLSSVM